MYFVLFGLSLTTILPFSFVIIVGSALIISHLSKNHHYAIYAQIICIIYITTLIQWSIGGVFALDMVRGLKKIAPRNGKRIAFRVGINSGPLVAGVIGQSKFHYDLWGDTVNIASRMESHGAVGKVHISAATYKLI